MLEIQSTRDLVLAFQANRDYALFSALAISDENTLPELIALCKTVEFPFPEYSSWLLSHITDRYPEKIQSFHTDLIDCYLDFQNESMQRNIMHALLVLPLIEYRDGEFLDRLFFLLTQTSTKVANRVYAMYYVLRFCTLYPDLKVELKNILELDENTYSPAYYAAKRKVLKKINTKEIH
jgi:hypothetical protein